MPVVLFWISGFKLPLNTTVHYRFQKCQHIKPSQNIKHKQNGRHELDEMEPNKTFPNSYDEYL